jgi:signal transduction histidine kinase
VPDFEPVLVHDLVSACLKPLERRVAARGLRIVRQIDRTSPEVRADREMLRRVIETLLAEAAEATVDGGRIRVCLKHSRAAVMLSIKDQGEGMSPDVRDALLSDASRPLCEGALLSLPACRDAVVRMGGSIFVNSTPGRGSTFYVTFQPPRLPPA